MASDIKSEPRTTMVPVTTMEDVPVLSPSERAELVASLEAAQSRVDAGEGVEHDAKSFKDRLMGIFRSAKR